VLDRDGIRGHWAESLLKSDEGDDDEDEEETDEPKGIGSVGVPDRHIYCIDLRTSNSFQDYVDEIRRIAAECRERRNRRADTAPLPVTAAVVDLGLNLLQNGERRGVSPPVNGVSSPANGDGAAPAFTADDLLKTPERRWYPVIDYSRCTNCMECIDFCLFGVYGIDTHERILVENQDQCRKGCPACSRVCPEQAIIFPNHKTPAIAGAPVGAIGALKIDLSKLFGGEEKDALSQAVEERDRELTAAGRGAVGMSVGIPKRQADKPQEPKDELDSLMDQLDDLEI
jgi:NAD-dependent dihydropyrimidine dehydrogenase PreA subunit